VVVARKPLRLSRKSGHGAGRDVAFVRRSASPHRPTQGYLRRARPGVEVLSPDDAAEEVEEKVDDYLSAGAHLVWVANPRRRTLTVHRPNQQPIVLREADTLDGGEVLAGFEMKIGEIFK